MFPASRRIGFKFEAYYPVEEYWREITTLLTDARINLGDVSSIGTGLLGGDGVVRIASLTLQNNRPTEGDIAPRDQSSEWNQNPITGDYDPLLRPSRRVRLFVIEKEPFVWGLMDEDEWALTDEDGVALVFEEPFISNTPVFDGFLGENTGTEPAFTFTALDHAKPFMRMFFEDGYTSNAGVPPSVAMQGLIDTIMPAKHRPQIIVEGVETFVMPEWEPVDTTVWNALQDVAGQMGWFLSFEFDADDDPVLVLREPPRGSTVADYSLSGKDLYSNRLVSSDADVRNEIVVEFVDRTVTPPVASRVLAIDVDSVANITDDVPVRAVLGGSNTALVSNPTDAADLAANVLHDLSDIYEVVSAVTPIFPQLKLFDILGLATTLLSGYEEFSVMDESEQFSIMDESEEFSIKGVRADNVPYSVSSIQHRISVSMNRATLETSFIATGRVIGRRAWWLEREKK